ncbi:TVP38/TMEM64 family protein [Desertifilum tharense]|uniref:TVP38/TMEM64 family protein n=1 Tax=Desertifilum TaxID=1185872 RepID=UPI0009F3ACF5|nr:TVP38/TMEM64 family protein [Desertifilum tharense]MDA0209574.1 TVP38/TMEM64 family protein [Cyanobacteria bacterium FC1]
MNNKKPLIITAIILILLIGGFAAIALKDRFPQIQDWLLSLGVWALPAFISMYVGASIIGIPSAILMLASGSLFGFFKGWGIVSLADTLSVVLCYGLGRTIARQWVKKWISNRKQFVALDRAVEHKGWKIVLFARLSPLLPSNILNYGFSLTKINFWHYLFFTWVGMLPVTGFYVYLGSLGGNLMRGQQSPGQLGLQLLGLGATILAIIYTTRLAKKTLSESLEAED